MSSLGCAVGASPLMLTLTGICSGCSLTWLGRQILKMVLELELVLDC
jgi:hypothetical protein